jgi:hypothetical protein
MNLITNCVQHRVQRTLGNAPLLVILALQMVLAVAAFVLPLLFGNRRLVFEKRKLLAEHNLRLKATLERLHSSIDEKQMDEVGQLNSAVNGLNLERTILNGIPTWPWRTNTLTNFLSTPGLPIFIYLDQLVIKSYWSFEAGPVPGLISWRFSSTTLL